MTKCLNDSMPKLAGKKITILGLGRHGGGVAAARFCALAGAEVRVTDLADAGALRQSLDQLANVPIARFTLGRHDEDDFRGAEVLVVNPAVRPRNSFVELARQAGAIVISETELFLDACPAQVIGVTGTVGKSTTASMLAAILKEAGKTTWLGGNIGHSLLGDLPRMSDCDVVVLELSSFQLHWLSEGAHWPRGAVITNCSPNHLDWHGGFENYMTAKRRLLAHLPADGVAVLNQYDSNVKLWTKFCDGVVYPMSHQRLPTLKIPGEHNRMNAACAAGMAQALVVSEEPISQALESFAGLPHRLQWIAEVRGRKIYNDSKATSPAATLAALDAMDQLTWILLGGVDEHLDFGPLLDRVRKQCLGAAVFGQAAARIIKLLEQSDSRILSYQAKNMEDALAWCFRKSKSGDAILLSPACPSTDEFRDFAERGEQFEQLAGKLSHEVQSNH